MGRAPCCDKANVKKGPWSPEEDSKLKDYIHKYGTGGNWIALPQKAGLKRCGKSCRLRWLNYLRPNLKHGDFSEHEDMVICALFANIGSRWSIIAGQLPGRTDNDIKNYWNTKLKKKLLTLAAPLPHTQTNNSQIQSSTLFQSHPMSPYYTNNPLNTTTCFSDIFQIQDHEGLVNPNLLVFGSDQASCSSSDGSYSNSRDNQIHSIKQEDRYHYHYQNHQMGPLHHHHHHHGFMNMSNANNGFCDSANNLKENGYFGEVPFSYDIDYGFNIFTNYADVDENKTQADGNDDGMKKEGMDMSQQCYY